MRRRCAIALVGVTSRAWDRSYAAHCEGRDRMWAVYARAAVGLGDRLLWVAARLDAEAAGSAMVDGGWWG